MFGNWGISFPHGTLFCMAPSGSFSFRTPPRAVGFTILELARLLMLRLHYDYYKDTYGDRATLCFTDTDALLYEIRTDDLIKDMVEAKDDEGTPIFDLAEALTELGHTEAAIEQWSLAYDNSSDPTIAVQRDTALVHLGCLIEARSAIDDAWLAHPEDLSIRSRLATALLRDHDLEAAIDCANQVLAIDPDHSVAAVHRLRR